MKIDRIPRKKCPYCKQFSPVYLYASHVENHKRDNAEFDKRLKEAVTIFEKESLKQ